jgi:galactokinase/mevalonate kinase-like predicted kinase
MNKSQRRQFTSWLGKRSYKARVARLGIERIRAIARENGKKGGRPKGSRKRRAKA